MQTIDLINKHLSDVDYKLTTFPDGEPHIVLSELNRKTNYLVICRIANPNDLFVLMQVGDILNRQAVDWDLAIFYLMSARMDRVIHFEESYTLKLVADTINNMHPRKVAIFHPHSNKTLQLINNSVDLETERMLDFEILHDKHTVYCFPDAGAAERYGKSFDRDKVITMCKVRDLENGGAIVSVDLAHPVDDVEPRDDNHVMIVDDLCDAGGTFIMAAKTLRKIYPKARLSIFVRHLVNPIGLKNLHENFDQVFITTSYKDWSEDVKKAQYKNVVVYDVAYPAFGIDEIRL